MNNLDKQYTDLLQDILDNGVAKQDRTGTGTISVFGRQIRHDMKDGFPLLTTKKMPWKVIVTELLWFLQGSTNIKYLVDNGCNIWNGDAYKNYESNWLKENPPMAGPYTDACLTMEEFINKIKTDDKFAKQWGDLGPIYGKQWRGWKKPWWVESELSIASGGTHGGSTYQPIKIDQIQNLINDLKTNPDSRRLMVNAWNVGELDQMVLPPCHYGFQVYTRELSLEERKKTHGSLFEEWETARNNFQSYTMKVTYGEPKDIQYNTEQANHWDSIHKKLTEQIKQIPSRAISLMWNQRSVDTFLGLPFNIASYGLLLMMIADEVNMIPDQLIGNLGDVHLYSNHIDAAKEQIGRDLTLEERFELAGNQYPPGGLPNQAIHFMNEKGIPKRTREPFPLPTVHVRDGMYCSSINDVLLFDYISHETIKAPLSN